MSARRRLQSVDVPYDTSDEGQVNEAKLAAAERDDRQKTTLHTLLATREGRELVWGWLSRCNIFATSVVPGDPFGTHMNEGARNIGLALLADVMRADPLSFSLMQQEAKDG